VIDINMNLEAFEITKPEGYVPLTQLSRILSDKYARSLSGDDYIELMYDLWTIHTGESSWPSNYASYALTIHQPEIQVYLGERVPRDFKEPVWRVTFDKKVRSADDPRGQDRSLATATAEERR